jgi:hypothetical protein
VSGISIVILTIAIRQGLMWIVVGKGGAADIVLVANEIF